ncbi:MAG TPA: hypothetical protein VKM35_13325 [Arenimonas sp.]|uniref:hypothetical protein n=1 Tax=Arenimonas sp. TaxID=1872635 RepID=UPI002C5A502C|nr:hypothetical protein [Arenimonas sp.]HMB58174.1 hypothetical protein [Arenimonas sp.]
MNDFVQLWLPILVTAGFIFIASSLIHMVFQWHKSEYQALSNEDAVIAAIRAGTAKPGQYVFPHCPDMKAMQGEEIQKKFREGPIGFLTLRQPGPPTIGGALIKWFLYTVLIAAIGGAVALQTYGLHSHSHHAGHLVGVLSLLAYAGGSVQHGIWKGVPWAAVAKDILDGLIYAIISALTFWWLWP